jgi:hypothetical protein
VPESAEAYERRATRRLPASLADAFEDIAALDEVVISAEGDVRAWFWWGSRSICGPSVLASVLVR